MSQEPRTGAGADGPAGARATDFAPVAGRRGAPEQRALEQEAPEQEAPGHPPGTVRTLRQAMRRARHDDAERVAAQTDQRLARLCRLEMLEDALQSLLAQIPADVDLFDVGLMPGATPRLFIDMIGFVEMGRDGRSYSFSQDTRHGRVQLAESADLDAIVEAVTDYVARRLLERDKALASDAVALPGRGPRGGSRVAAPAGHGPQAGTPRRARRLGWLGTAFAFVIDLFGSIAFFAVLAGIGWLVWNRLHGQS